MAETKRRSKEGTASQTDHVCPVGFCPIGMFLTATGHARPEAVEHLVAAGREFMLALSSVMSARADDLGRTSPLERIDLE